MECKLTMNISTGQLEVEGSETLVTEIYKDFKDLFLQNGKSPTTINNPQFEERVQPDVNHKHTYKQKSTPKSGASGKGKASAELRVLTDLNLRPKGKISLKDYAAKYNIRTSEELSLLVIYYLKEELNEKVTVNHIFSCYKELGKKIPQHFKQTLINQKNNKNWIDVNDWDDIKYTVPGMNYMEHDFQKTINGK